MIDLSQFEGWTDLLMPCDLSVVRRGNQLHVWVRHRDIDDETFLPRSHFVAIPTAAAGAVAEALLAAAEKG